MENKPRRNGGYNDDEMAMTTDITRCERCGETFKSALGVKIHQGKKKRCGSTSEARNITQVLCKT